ncbi:MAG: UDP-N-acetylmuramoyl-tripeptide--D-alanyl-D-alanine ligase [Peptococcaceae bacterium]|nr:UDP-N-acetylmuramoyl-tripeptide--D-alanyl-D-alanine ligase [Peptococcaceae bacterium]
MFSIYFFIFLASFIFYFWYGLRHSLHMLQLSSYFADRFLLWLKENKRKEETFLLAGLIVANLAFANFMPLSLYLVFHALVFLVLRLTKKRRPEKKALVFTWRIRRLLITFTILCVAFVTLLGLALNYFGKNSFWWELPFLLGFLNLMKDSFILMANGINRPIEKRIAQGYVDDAKKRLAELPGLQVIGITGSFGKTSTKYILNQLLSTKYQTLMTPESFNTPMGVVRTIREQLNGTHQIFIVEMGAKKPGDIREICQIVQPRLGVISSVGEMHLETFKTLDNIIKTKFELADAVKEKGLIFLNYDNEYIRKEKRNQPKVCYGIGSSHQDNQQLDVWSENIESGPGGSAFDLCFKNGEKIHCRTKLLGRHNVVNITAAAAVSYNLGIEPQKLLPAINRLEPIPHRLQLMPPGSKYQIIDDAYNSNPEGARQALEILGSFDGYRVLATPGMVELGNMEDELNRRLGRQAAKNCDYIIIVGANRSFGIQDGAKRAGFDVNKIYVAKDIRDALDKADQLADSRPDRREPMYLLLENDLTDNYL